jgi:pectate lyase
MKKRVLAISIAMIGILGGCVTVDYGTEGGEDSSNVSDIGRATLPANDGWAAGDGPVTGGSEATAENDFTVSSRKELVDAVAKAGKAPKIIRIKGTINLSSDDSGRELVEKDYAVAPYNFAEYMKAYAPAVWNTKLEKGRPNRNLSGPQEEAREASVKKQREHITLKLSSNTTIVGIGSDAKIVKGNIWIGPEAENVIIRNIAFEDAFDYFTGWDPGDSFKVDKSYPGCQDAFVDANTGPQKCPGGRWNSEYDSISVNGGKRVWIDHCSFSDGDRSDKLFPPVFPFPQNEITQKVQHHDGTVDITNGANFVTISYSIFKDHDKAFLIGGSDSSKIDTGKLNVTIHNNYFDNVGQRMPRVRFGKVHTYNNYFVGDAAGNDDPKLSAYQNHLATLKVKHSHNIFRQAIGAGKDSAIYSEANVFEIKNGGSEFAVGNMGGTVFFDHGSIVNGQPLVLNVSKPLSANVGWKPVLYGKNKVLPAAEVPGNVKANAGPGKL